VSDGRALAREFLEQQRLLGGNHVILPGSKMRDAGCVDPRPPAAPHPASRIPHPASPIPHPDLPPAGLSYDPPGSDLFSNDPVPQAGSLAGELLTKILAAIDLPRERVFICNVVKCRPPENRVPQYDEIAACLPYLLRQIELVKPAVILAMGGTAAQTLLNTKQSLGALRNQVHRVRGIPVIVTYHPAALLRNPNWKKPTWDDVRIARRFID